MTYRVTAVVQDNRENTMKVCCEVENSFEAADAVCLELAGRLTDTPPSQREQIVQETWAILYLSCMHEEEVGE